MASNGKINAITSITASILFVIAIGMLVGQIAYLRTQNTLKAKTALAQIATGINGATTEKIDSVCMQYASLQALTLKVKDKQIYAKARTEAFFAQNADGEKALKPVSSMFKKFSTAFSWQDGNVCVLEAVFPVLESQDIFKAALIPLVLILAGTAYIFIVLALGSGGGNAKNAAIAQAEGAAKGMQSASSLAMMKQSGLQPDFAARPAQERIPEAASALAPAPSAEAPAANENGHENNPQSKSDSPKIEETRTGLLPEAYLAPALEDALYDAQTHDTDISLFVICVAGISAHADEEEKVCKVIGGTFYDTHTIFELTPESFAVVVPQLSIDDALMIAESLFIPLSNAVKEIDPQPVMGIGISGKQGRNVSAMRLLRETLQANERAMENPEQPIVALKIDKEKYESYQKTHPSP